jgi:predicted NUDIX family phosphoesterase
VVYVLLECGGRFVHYARRAPGDDARLRGRSSIGFGGHIDGGDVGEAPRALEPERAAQLLLSVGAREVHEEVVIDSRYEATFLGVVNDDRDAVGRVHFGFVLLWRLREPRVAAREEGICDVEFLAPDELLDSSRPLESWTQLCLDHVRRFASPCIS